MDAWQREKEPWGVGARTKNEKNLIFKTKLILLSVAGCEEEKRHPRLCLEF